MFRIALLTLVIFGSLLCSCAKILHLNENKIAIVNNSNVACAASIRLDGGDAVQIKKGEAFTFEKVSKGNHKITLMGNSPCTTYMLNNTCDANFLHNNETKTITVLIANAAGAQLTLNCN
jgi:hypothetical protein